MAPFRLVHLKVRLVWVCLCPTLALTYLVLGWIKLCTKWKQHPHFIIILVLCIVVSMVGATLRLSFGLTLVMTTPDRPTTTTHSETSGPTLGPNHIHIGPNGKDMDQLPPRFPPRDTNDSLTSEPTGHIRRHSSAPPSYPCLTHSILSIILSNE